jgi:uncharacterized protein
MSLAASGMMRAIVLSSGLLLMLLAGSARGQAPTTDDDEPLQGDAAINVGLAACDAGDAVKCRETAALMQKRRVSSRKGKTPGSLRARADELLEQQCSAGEGAACFAQGEPLARHGSENDAATGRSKITRACTLKYGDACLFLAHHAKSARKALELFELACINDSPRGCHEVALRLGARERARIAELHHKACAGNVLAACLRSAELRLATKDRDGAASDLQTACDLGDMPTCDRAGALTNDPKRARELFRRACDAKVASGCAHLADFVAVGKGGERHWGDALDLAQHGCELANASRCTHAEQLRKHPPDASCASVAECRRLCDERIGPSCAALAPMLAAAERERLYENGCEYGDGASCAVLGDAELDPESAVTTYARACKLGHSRSCTYARFTAARSGSRPAREAMLKACATDVNACVLLGLAIEAKDVKSAKALWLDACSRHPGAACRLAAYGVEKEFQGRGPICWTGTAADDACFAEAKQLLTKACEAKDQEGCELLNGHFYGSSEPPPAVVLPVASPRWQ